MSAARNTPTSDRGVVGVQNRLRESSEKIAQLDRQRTAETRRRDLLILKLTAAGESTRGIGAVAGISSPAVTYAVRRAREALGGFPLETT